MKGLSCALTRLRAMPDRTRRSSDDAALAAAKAALSIARSLSPVRTGRLRDSLRAEPTKNGAALTACCPYAVYVELGARYAPAQPFLTPALRAAAYPALLARSLKEAIK